MIDSLANSIAGEIFSTEGSTVNPQWLTEERYAQLHTAKRTWVGLTDEEFKQIMLNTYNIDLNVSGHSSDDHLLWNAIEAKLKEKNT